VRTFFIGAPVAAGWRLLLFVGTAGWSEVPTSSVPLRLEEPQPMVGDGDVGGEMRGVCKSCGASERASWWESVCRL
jgi:hypothetical protein